MKFVLRIIIATTLIASTAHAEEPINTNGVEEFLISFQRAITQTDVTSRCDKHFVAIQTLNSADLELLFEIAKSRLGDKMDEDSVRLFAYLSFFDILLKTYTEGRVDDCIAAINFTN